MLLLGGLLRQPPSASVSTHKHMYSRTDMHPHTQSDMHIDYKQVKQNFWLLPTQQTSSLALEHQKPILMSD